MIADEYYYWPVAPTVQSLLLHQDRLVVVANGYGQVMRNELDYMPVLYDAFSTNVRIYDISQLGTTRGAAACQGNDTFTATLTVFERTATRCILSRFRA